MRRLERRQLRQFERVGDAEFGEHVGGEVLVPEPAHVDAVERPHARVVELAKLGVIDEQAAVLAGQFAHGVVVEDDAPPQRLERRRDLHVERREQQHLRARSDEALQRGLVTLHDGGHVGADGEDVVAACVEGDERRVQRECGVELFVDDLVEAFTADGEVRVLPRRVRAPHLAGHTIGPPAHAVGVHEVRVTDALGERVSDRYVTSLHRADSRSSAWPDVGVRLAVGDPGHEAWVNSGGRAAIDETP